MRKIPFLMIVMLISACTMFAQVGINIDSSDPDASSGLDVKFTNKGFLPPRVADTNAISTPAEGLMVYDLGSHCIRYYNGTQWSECIGIYSWFCGVPITITHVAGNVAPVNKTVTYRTATDIPGETTKCWITSNLGANQQATAVNDATEASAGWYWQFNRKQGYKHDGTTRTPNTTWISSISESSDWTAAEWVNVDASGGWTNWNGPWSSGLKMHAAGYLGYSDGSLNYRGSNGYYWSSTQYSDTYGWYMNFYSSNCSMYFSYKSYGFSLRCIKD